MDALIDSVLDMECLLPACYAAWAPVLRDALGFFLERLEPRHRLAIFTEQAALGFDASPEERFVALLRRCPTLHKLGQVISRDRRLAPELRTRLQALESLSPAQTTSQLAPLIFEQLGRSMADLRLEEMPLAEASVAIVVPFTYGVDGGRVGHGVLKLLKPGIEERLQEELDIWAHLGDYLDEQCELYGLPSLDYGSTVDSVRELLLDEVRLDREQANLDRAHAFYADVEYLVVPRRLPWSTPRMTAMDRVFGDKVTEAPHDASRRTLAVQIVEGLVARPFWGREERAFFHADPHAGNLLWTRDGRLGVLDWSLVTTLDKARRVALVQMLLAGMTLDEGRLQALLCGMARAKPAPEALARVTSQALRRIRGGQMPGLEWLIDLLDRAVLEAGLGLDHEMMLFRKAFFSLRDVVEDVWERTVAGGVVLGSALCHLLAETPLRLFAPYESHAFPTHVSTEDLVRTFSAWPLAMGRLWVGLWQDVAQGAVAGVAQARHALAFSSYIEGPRTG